MSGEVVRASDDDRERAIASLREHLTAGRLTLEEFTERMSVALAATRTADLDAPLRELPVARPARRRPTRFLLALFGSTEREGRRRLRRRAQCVDVLPLPGTQLVRVYACGAFAGMDVWRVPAWAKRTLGQVIKGIERGEQRELEP